MSELILAIGASIVVVAFGAQLLWNGEAVGLWAVRIATGLLPAEMADDAGEEWSRHVLDLAAEGHRMAPALWGLRAVPAAVKVALPTSRLEFEHRFPGRRGAAESVVLGVAVVVGAAVAVLATVALLAGLNGLGPSGAWPLLLPIGLLGGLVALAVAEWREVFATKGWSGRRIEPPARFPTERPELVTLDQRGAGPDAGSDDGGSGVDPDAGPDRDPPTGSEPEPEPGTCHLHLPSGRAEMLRRGPIDVLLLNTSGQTVSVRIGAGEGRPVAVTQKIKAFETGIGAVHVTNLGDADITVAVVPVGSDGESEPELVDPAALAELANS